MADQMNRMKSLLTSYYGVGGESREQQQRNARDLDSSAFEVESYVKELLQHSQIPVLLARDDKLVQEVKTLDADMQLLVYDNYSKFIAATDTIRKMKNKVSEIEGDIERLVQKTELISNETREVNQELSGKRQKLEKLIALQRLIRKLKFLFELPSRLRKLIKKNNPRKAVEYFQMASPILLQYTNVASFAKIQQDSSEIVDGLQVNLGVEINEMLPDTSVQEFDDKISLLIMLNESKRSELCSRFVEWHQVANRTRLARVKDEPDIEMFISAANEATLEQVTTLVNAYSTLFLPSTNLDQESDQESGMEEEETTLQKSSDDLNENQKLLDSLLKTVMKDYFACVRSRFLKLDIVTYEKPRDRETEESDQVVDSQQVSFDIQDVDEVSDGDENDTDKTQDLFRPMLGALRLFFGDLEQLASEVEALRPHRLIDRATEVTEHAIRHQVVAAFDHLRLVTRERVQQLKLDCASIEVDESSIADGSDLRSLPLTANRAIMTEVDNTLSTLRQMVDAGSTIFGEMTSIFESLVNFHLYDWFVWFGELLVKESDPMSHKGFECSDEIEQVPSSQQSTPVYALVLATLCQETSQFVESSALSVVDLPGLLSKLSSSTNVLLNGYIELHGHRISAVLQDSFDEQKWHDVSMEPSEIRPIILQIWSDLKLISNQVVEIVGESAASTLPAQTSEPGTSIGAVTPTSSSSSSRNVLGALEMDVAKMFSEKVELLGEAALSSNSLGSGVLKLVFKTMAECVRLESFNKFGFQQVMLDVAFLRSALPLMIEDTSVLFRLLSEVESACRDRTLDPIPMDHHAVSAICNAKREQIQFQN